MRIGSQDSRESKQPLPEHNSRAPAMNAPAEPIDFGQWSLPHSAFHYSGGVSPALGNHPSGA